MSLAHVTLATRDVQASLAFFSGALGWRPIARPRNVGRPAAWLQIAPGQELHLVEVPDFQPSASEGEFGRHVALSFPVSEFAALKVRLASHGAELIAPERETPFARFFFRDPNGYVFEVVEFGHRPEL
jgi:catechol 2,3-dioxygenase-like lactoylglutathione lyase family enzyme